MAKKRANGEGNIRKRADGRWEGRYTAGYHPETGKRIIKNVLGKTQAECKAKLSAALESVKGIDVSRADEYTVATWLRSWYDIYAKPNVRVATADRYQLMVEQYTIPRIGSIKLTKLTAHDLQKLYKELMENGRIDRKSGHGNPGLSSTTVRSLHLMLRFRAGGQGAPDSAQSDRGLHRSQNSEVRDADPSAGTYQRLFGCR